MLLGLGLSRGLVNDYHGDSWVWPHEADLSGIQARHASSSTSWARIPKKDSCQEAGEGGWAMPAVTGIGREDRGRHGHSLEARACERRW